MTVLHQSVEPQSVEPRQDRPVLDDGLFADLLAKERRRADRSGKSFVLVAVGLVTDSSRAPESFWYSASETLATVTRDSDVIGWLESRRRLGAIIREIDGPDSMDPASLEKRVRDELVRRSDAPSLARLTVRLGDQTADLGAPEGHVVEAPLPAGGNQASATLKRTVDVVGSVTLMAALSPLFAVLAVLVKLTSRGPVFFRQARMAQTAKTFTMLKFRTMTVGADPTPHQEFVTQFIVASGKASSDKTRESGNNEPFKLENDRRITPFGRFLRRSSLDELPQLWNVLRGEMSLVGPRPPIPYELKKYQRWHRRRVLDAKPGITGLWQVYGRSRTTFDEMVRLDLKYARTWSIWTDLKLILMTPLAMLRGKGAR